MGTLEDRIDALIKQLVHQRELVLTNYLTALEKYDPREGSMESVERAGILHDLDKHITNCELEIQRLKAIEQQKTFLIGQGVTNA